MSISVIPAAAAGSKEKRVDAFTASGTWTVPSGVTYAIAHIRGAGGGSGYNLVAPGDGGNSSVAFGVTVTANGGKANVIDGSSNQLNHSRAGANNSGQGATITGARVDISWNSAGSAFGGDGAFIVSGSTVTPAGSITITIGAGGTAGSNGAAGGSGFVFIEYYE
jgi:hypothetical protein